MIPPNTCNTLYDFLISIDIIKIEINTIYLS